MENWLKLENQVVIVTGGASGIGHAVIEEFLADGCRVVCVDMNPTPAVFAGANEENYLYVPCDITSKAAVDAMTGRVMEKFGRIDVLVNNAGMYRFGETLDIDSGFTTKMLALHVLTPTRLCLLFGQDMRRQRHGYILNMSSVTAWLAYPGINVYGATKRYLKNFSRGLHTELRDYGVYVTAVCPGAVDTDLYNLNEKLRRRLVRSGIMLPPGKLARKAVRALFRGKAVLVPGLLNRLALPFIGLIPHSLIRRAARRSGILPLQS